MTCADTKISADLCRDTIKGKTIVDTESGNIMPEKTPRSRIMICGETPSPDFKDWSTLLKRIQKTLEATADKHPEGIEVICGMAPGVEMCASVAAMHAKAAGHDITLTTWEAHFDEAAELAQERRSNDDPFGPKLADAIREQSDIHHVRDIDNRTIQLMRIANASNFTLIIGDHTNIENSMVLPANNNACVIDQIGWAATCAVNAGRDVYLMDMRDKNHSASLSKATKALDEPIIIENVPAKMLAKTKCPEMGMGTLIFQNDEHSTIAYLSSGAMTEQPDSEGRYKITVRTPNVHAHLQDKDGHFKTCVLSAEDFAENLRSGIKQYNAKSPQETKGVALDTKPAVEEKPARHEKPAQESPTKQEPEHKPARPTWDDSCTITLVPNIRNIYEEQVLVGTTVHMAMPGQNPIAISTTDPSMIENQTPWEMAVPPTADRQALRYLAEADLAKPIDIQGDHVIFALNLDALEAHMEKNGHTNCVEKLIDAFVETKEAMPVTTPVIPEPQTLTKDIENIAINNQAQDQHLEKEVTPIK